MGLLMHVVLDATKGLPALAGKREEDIVTLEHGEMTIAGIPDGTASGAPAVGLVFTLPDGRTVFAQTTLRLLLMAATALRGRYGAP